MPEAFSWSTTVGGSDKAGLHLRPAALVARAAACFRSKILIECGGRSANAKSAISILLLGAGPGAVLCITVKGSDAEAAWATVREVLAPVCGAFLRSAS